MTKRKIKLWHGVIALVVALFIANVFFAIQTSSQGARVLMIEQEADEILSLNRELKTLIVEESSLKRLSEEVGSLGFYEPEQVVYFNTDEPFALK